MDKTFTQPGTALADLEVAWQDRLADAEALLAAGRNAGAIAATIYALEIRLKVSICKKLDLPALPRAFEMHDLGGLLLLAGLSQRMLRRSATPVKPNWDALVAASKNINDLRYRPGTRWGGPQAAALLSQLKDPPGGVLPWLARQR